MSKMYLEPVTVWVAPRNFNITCMCHLANLPPQYTHRIVAKRYFCCLQNKRKRKKTCSNNPYWHILHDADRQMLDVTRKPAASEISEAEFQAHLTRFVELLRKTNAKKFAGHFIMLPHITGMARPRYRVAILGYGHIENCFCVSQRRYRSNGFKPNLRRAARATAAHQFF